MHAGASFTGVNERTNSIRSAAFADHDGAVGPNISSKSSTGAVGPTTRPRPARQLHDRSTPFTFHVGATHLPAALVDPASSTINTRPHWSRSLEFITVNVDNDLCGGLPHHTGTRPGPWNLYDSPVGVATGLSVVHDFRPLGVDDHHGVHSFRLMSTASSRATGGWRSPRVGRPVPHKRR